MARRRRKRPQQDPAAAVRRVDRSQWKAEHPAPPAPDEAVEPPELAPYASSGGYTPYSFPGGQIKMANFLRGWGARRGPVGWVGRALVLLLLASILAGVVAEAVQLLR